MSKQIFASEAEINEILAKAKENLLSKKNFGALELKFDLKRDNRKANLIFSPIAWVKQKTLVEKFDTEVEWHGLVRRVDEATFEVYDILVPPHTVAAATVTADLKEYTEWINALDDETFFALRFHGHSHVNMGTTPSGTDMKYREDVVTQIPKPDADKGEDGFYIFMILNKSGNMTVQIFDLLNNAIYDTGDVDVDVDIEDDYLSSFVEEAKKVAVKAAPPTTSYQSIYSVGQGWYGGKKDDDDWYGDTYKGGYFKGDPFTTFKK